MAMNAEWNMLIPVRLKYNIILPDSGNISTKADYTCNNLFLTRL